MANHVFSVKAGDPAPIGSGTADGWLRYYKFRPGSEEELYVRMPVGTNAAEGDTFTFVVDGEALGVVPILRVEHDFITEEEEIWYRGEDILVLSPAVPETTLASALAALTFPTSSDVLRAELEKCGLRCL